MVRLDRLQGPESCWHLQLWWLVQPYRTGRCVCLCLSVICGHLERSEGRGRGKECGKERGKRKGKSKGGMEGRK